MQCYWLKLTQLTVGIYYIISNLLSTTVLAMSNIKYIK